MAIAGYDDFKAKTVVVTGAATGIGKSIVIGFAERGADVVAVDVKAEALEKLGSECPGIKTLAIDLTSPEGPREIVQAAAKIDVLCNNAGVLDRLALVDETTDEDWDRVVAVNATAPFRICREAIPLMLAAGGGAIVNTTSQAGLRGGRGGAAYTASKFALVGLTLNIAAAYGSQGIRSNAIAPGPTVTDIGSGVTLAERGASFYLRDIDQVPRNTPDYVAPAVIFLASDAARHINGAVLTVDQGGMAF